MTEGGPVRLLITRIETEARAFQNAGYSMRDIRWGRVLGLLEAGTIHGYWSKRVAVVVLPMAQPLRILRSVRVLRAMRVARAATYMARGAEEGRSLFSRENFSYTMVVTFIALGGTALIVWSVERDAPNSNIHSLPDAVWWAITTISTVGYGDKFPVTAEGEP